MKRSLPILLAVLLSACASSPGPNIPSGNLAITVANVRRDCVREVMANALVSYGYQIESKSDNQIIAGRIAPEAFFEDRLSVLFLPQYDVDALMIVIYTNSVRHPGTAFESLQPIYASQIEQDQLDLVKQKIQSNCAARRS